MSTMGVDEEALSVTDGSQGGPGIDSLISMRLVGANRHSARLAQFMLFLPQSQEKELNKSTVEQ